MLRSPAPWTREELANYLTFLHKDLTDAGFLTYARRQADAVLDEVAMLLASAVDHGELTVDADVYRLAGAIRALRDDSMVPWALAGEVALEVELHRNLDALPASHLVPRPDQEAS